MPWRCRGHGDHFCNASPARRTSPSTTRLWGGVYIVHGTTSSRALHPIQRVHHQELCSLRHSAGQQALPASLSAASHDASSSAHTGWHPLASAVTWKACLLFSGDMHPNHEALRWAVSLQMLGPELVLCCRELMQEDPPSSTLVLAGGGGGSHVQDAFATTVIPDMEDDAAQRWLRHTPPAAPHRPEHSCGEMLAALPCTAQSRCSLSPCQRLQGVPVCMQSGGQMATA